jgi:hypothetical protein
MVLAKFGLRVRIGWQTRAESKPLTMVSALVLNYFGAQLYALIERLAFFSIEAGLLAPKCRALSLSDGRLPVLGR